MLQTLTIRNIALIERLTIDFGRGLHTLTGETGAGKSIIVDAVNLVLGGRADRTLIRTGTEKAGVEAVFGEEALRVAAPWLEAQMIDPEDSLLTLSREINTAGRSVNRVCGVPVPLTALRELSALLMDVHGQHETRFLMDPRYHLQLLDAAGDEEHGKLLSETAEACDRFLACHRRYARLVRENDQRTRRTEEVAQALEELSKARLREGEEEQLIQERDRCRHAEKIAQALRTAYAALADGEMDPAVGKAKTAVDALETLKTFGEPYASLAERLHNTYYELEECGYELAGLLGSDAFDAQRAERVENRLALIARLKRRYGEDIPAILRTFESLKGEAQQLAGIDGELKELAEEDKRLLQHYRQLSRRLTASREALAARFEQGMTEQLADLGMGATEFKVAFEPRSAKPPMPRPTGDDDLAFMISPNPGEPLKPLSRIASGGELSRLMLALKNMEAARAGVDCMVFDEIDTGISGRVAQAVAEKLAAISRERQVLCVTHLPQLAAMADTQLLVEKTVENGRTGTHVRCLDGDGRVREVARMLGGAAGSDESALTHAAQMIRAAEELKESCRKGLQMR
ncbi:MAG: DNA repair protein RecN [Clostridia bacterium]|nr:DNA repair protein RecN [Clostridia bacterium]